MTVLRTSKSTVVDSRYTTIRFLQGFHSIKLLIHYKSVQNKCSTKTFVHSSRVNCTEL